MKLHFEIGHEIKHQIDIAWSLFGLEAYKVDGKEVLKLRSFKIKGSRKFIVTDPDNTYEVEIKVDMAPTIKSWLFPGDWVTEVYVNNELFIQDLTSDFRAKVKRIDRVLNVFIGITLSFLAIMLIILFITKIF